MKNPCPDDDARWRAAMHRRLDAIEREVNRFRGRANLADPLVASLLGLWARLREERGKR